MPKVIESGCGNTTVLAGDEVAAEFYADPAARTRVVELLKEQPAGTFLRVGVHGGGCSGFRNEFGFDTILEDEDFRIADESGSVLIAVDSVSMQILKGSTLRYLKEISGEYFQIENPHVRSQCGCGESYSVETADFGL